MIQKYCTISFSVVMCDRLDEILVSSFSSFMLKLGDKRNNSGLWRFRSSDQIRTWLQLVCCALAHKNQVYVTSEGQSVPEQCRCRGRGRYRDRDRE